MVRIPLDPRNPADYAKFIECKRLPSYSVVGKDVHTTKEAYDWLFNKSKQAPVKVESKYLFNYQTMVVNVALKRKVYAPFLDCGLGKTAIILHWAQALSNIGKVLILCPLQVIGEFYNDFQKFGIDGQLTNLRETGGKWESGIAIVNYEYERQIDLSGVIGIALDESSILKNGDGKTKQWLCDLASNIEYRLACSATPAPNDHSEYASHAVFLGLTKTNKEFYSRFFRKDGNDWVLKAHAVAPFYEYLSSFSCYIQNPTLLGFECGGYLEDDPEIIEVSLPGGEHLNGDYLFQMSAGLSESMPVFRYRQEVGTPRFDFVVETAMQYHSIVWCKRNEEEANFSKHIPNSAVITGKTPIDKRVEILDKWRKKEIGCIISKPEILGWGVNMQQAEAHIYSGYCHSFEKFYQAVRRSHRYGRQGRLKVFIPKIAAEEPIFDILKEKIKTFKNDVRSLQDAFKNSFKDEF